MDGFFFPSILLCSQTSYDPQEGLVKFDYGPNMTVEKFKSPFIFWLCSGTCCRNLAILFLIFEKTILYMCQNLKSFFSGWKNTNFFPPTKHWLSSVFPLLAKFYHIFDLHEGISMKKWPEFARFSPKISKLLDFCDKFQYVGKNIERFFVSTFISSI